MSATPPAPVRPLAPLLLLALSLAESLLSLYQWMELLVVRAGGHALCSVNEVLNCEAVWSSSFAQRLHALTFLPVAGLGLVWGLAGFGLGLVLVYRLLAGKDAAPAAAGAKLLAAVGLASCITFGVASARMGSLCLTCLGTYALVLSYGLVAARGLPGPLVPQGAALKRGAGWAAALAAGAYLVLLGPGSQTAQEGGPTLAKELEQTQKAPPPPRGEPGSPLERFLTQLPEEQQREVSASLAVYRQSPSPPLAYPSRLRQGSPDAPVKIVEFTDVRCPHCKHLEETLKELRQALPDGSLSVEPRAFPLDGECNKVIAFTDGTHVRCTGAKALICLESRPEYWNVRDQLFAEQDNLSVARILELARSGGLSKDALEKCMASPDTAAKLDQDIAYAMQFRPQGTPLVLVNGREGTASPAFLYAMALTGGNANASAFDKLAPASGPGAP